MKYIIRREGEMYRLYSSVPENWHGYNSNTLAENFIREVGVERGYAVLELTALALSDNVEQIEHEIGENYG